MQNYQNRSTENYEKVDIIPTSCLIRPALGACMRRNYWTLFHIHNTDWSVCVSANPVVMAKSTCSENTMENSECVRVTSRRHIPRRCRTKYKPGLTEESKSIYEAYQNQYSRNPFDEETLETWDILTYIIPWQWKPSCTPTTHQRESHNAKQTKAPSTTSICCCCHG